MILIATPANMIVNSELINGGYMGFKFFPITLIGIPVMLLAIIYIELVHCRLGNREMTLCTDSHRQTFMTLLVIIN
ncbi:MAG: hypothetical protein ACTS7E_01830 [Arsenophonus sp. NC-CH8-MAG3]